MNLKEQLKHPIFNIISEIVDRKKLPCFVIGGFVRDLLMDRANKDIDVVVLGSGIELAEEVGRKIGGVKVNVFRNFGTAMLRYKDYDIEFVGARKESYRRDSRKPIVENGSLQDDQNRRDFTINSLAISLNRETYGELIDTFEGIKDLEQKIIRTPLEPDTTFSDDPLRMMRAVRFATQLNFSIEDSALKAIARNKDRIKIISAERIIDELNKIILATKPSIGFRILESTGLLDIIFPEMQKLKGVDVIKGKGHKDNFYHTIQVLDNVAKKSDKLWLRWAAILHDIAKPITKRYDESAGWTFHAHEFKGSKMVPRIFRRMKLPLGNPMKYVQKMVLLHLRPIVLAQEIVTDSAVRRLLFDAGDDIDDLMMLCEADITSKNDNKVRKFLQNFKLVREKLKEIEEKDAVRNFQPPVSGEIIMSTYNIGPSREVGIIKNAIKEAILEGEIHNNFEEAFRYMQQKASELGLKQEIGRTRAED